jgi:hypothetical protein
MKTPGVKYAVIALIFSIVWTLLEHVLGYNTTKHEIGQYARLIPAFVYYFLVVVAVYETRKQQGDSLSFKDGMKTGRILSLTYSLGITVWYALYGEVINKEYKTTLMAFERSKLEAARATPGDIIVKMKEVDMTSGGSVLSYVVLFAFMAFFGIVIAAIASLIMKRKKVVLA